MSKKFDFNAIGRDLFADERTVLKVFNAKYNSAEVVSPEEALKRMQNVRKSVQKNGPRVSKFFTEVQATKSDIAKKRQPLVTKSTNKEAA